MITRILNGGPPRMKNSCVRTRRRIRYMIPCAEDVRRGVHLPVPIHVRRCQQTPARSGLFDLQEDAIICRLTSVVRTGALDFALKDGELLDSLNLRWRALTGS